MTDTLLNLVETILNQASIREGDLFFTKDKDEWTVKIGTDRSPGLLGNYNWNHPIDKNLIVLVDKELKTINLKNLPLRLTQTISYKITLKSKAVYPDTLSYVSYTFKVKKRTDLQQLLAVARTYDT